MSEENQMILNFFLAGTRDEDLELACYQSIRTLKELGLEVNGNLYDEGTEEFVIWAAAQQRFLEWTGERTPEGENDGKTETS